ncbi:hypothetical protein TNCV_5097821 [Trichonephila clavipes]|nr:hypothetical protein TNCV_5097821 [Trichonephila clavipes]
MNPALLFTPSFMAQSSWLSDQCTWPYGHCLLFDLGEAVISRPAVIIVKEVPAPIVYRMREAKSRLLWPSNDKGRGAWYGPAPSF